MVGDEGSPAGWRVEDIAKMAGSTSLVRHCLGDLCCVSFRKEGLGIPDRVCTLTPQQEGYLGAKVSSGMSSPLRSLFAKSNRMRLWTGTFSCLQMRH